MKLKLVYFFFRFLTLVTRGKVATFSKQTRKFGYVRNLQMYRARGAEIGNNSLLIQCTLSSSAKGDRFYIGDNCTIGHNAIIHGCTIGNNSLIGMGATILNNAKIGNNCLVGAGALVTENKEFPDGSLIVGSPAKAVRELSQEMIDNMTRSSKHYVANFKKFTKELSLIK